MNTMFHPSTLAAAPTRDKPSVTLHPTVSHVHGGFRPMVIMRDKKGRCIGSKVERDAVYPDAAEARAWARCAANQVALEYQFVKVK